MILTFILLTEMAWLIGFGGMRLAGYESHDHAKSFHHTQQDMPADNSSEAAKPGASDNGSWKGGARHYGTQDDSSWGRSEDSHIVFKLHRHDDEGLHLHGSLRGWDDHAKDGPGRHGRHDHRHDHRHNGHQIHRDTDHHGGPNAHDGADMLELVVALALLIPLFATGSRRLHDSGKSGWWQLFVLIPVAGWLVLVIFFLLPGEQTHNRYGPTPS
ncbi:MAG: DUF805 domain-containing protein [Candidatus Puniceispirillaceae bacterium]